MNLITIFLILILRYFLIAAVVIFGFDKWKKIQPFKINHKITLRQYKIEFLYSLSSMVILSFFVYLAIILNEKNMTSVYFDIDDYPIIWTLLSVPILIVIHDLYFYLTHRLLHMRFFYRKIHQIHHQFQSTSVFSVFSFHPLEAVIQFSFIPLVVLFFPIHIGALLIFGMIAYLMNVYGHFGYDFYPKVRFHPFFRKVLNTSTHHQMHHGYNKNNYSLYLNIWDHFFGTNNPKY